ncbi:enoyl-CoA hydratase/isomerase family protein [Segetibacter aerophilus]|uniref:Enoyl-CoA hydratase n=1 Tax=Segetibacter aerophilus TaxID=670293 RepID=A0A512BJ40_9BACT|nr:enoyl-CoA hydratase/isomerase family protein [Segetibacter aerophilus]GEO11973.1 enoyl-CoA hydratase [Segetibacter aerophilus]
MITELNGGYVKTEKEHGITTIEFYHEQSNSMPGKLLEALAQAIHSEGVNSSTKVIILKSAGDRAFCSGASFGELEKITTPQEGALYFGGVAKVINAMRKTPQFVIARIHGKCLGGGVGIVAAADYAIAVEGADIKLTELALGIGPFVIGPPVQRRIGLSSFSQLTIDSNTWRSADWAKRKGLYAELHPELSGMEESIERLSFTLSHSNPEAMKELKREFWAGTEDWDELLKERASISGRLILSEHSKAAIEKFKSRSKSI